MLLGICWTGQKPRERASSESTLLGNLHYIEVTMNLGESHAEESECSPKGMACCSTSIGMQVSYF